MPVAENPELYSVKFVNQHGEIFVLLGVPESSVISLLSAKENQAVYTGRSTGKTCVIDMSHITYIEVTLEG